MEDKEVGTYASFVSRVGRASSELRDIEGAGDSFMEMEERGVNVVYSSNGESDEDGSMEDETTLNVVTADPTENADKTTLVIPPEQIQGFLREAGLSSRPRTGIKVNMENGQFLCPICQHPFKRRHQAIHHTYTHMNELELQKVDIYHQRCPYSPNKIFFRRQQYADHINSHEEVKNFKCKICKKGFVWKRSLQNHMLTHVNRGSQEIETPIPWRHFQCYFCPKKFGSMFRLISHMSSHTKETPYKCIYCTQWFPHNSSMRYHMRQVHFNPNNLKLLHCPQCPTTWNERRRLTRHIKNVHGEKVKTRKCPKCTKSFSDKTWLDEHIDGVHGNIRHKCPHCEKTYSTRTNMKTHIRKGHGGNQ